MIQRCVLNICFENIHFELKSSPNDAIGFKDSTNTTRYNYWTLTPATLLGKSGGNVPRIISYNSTGDLGQYRRDTSNATVRPAVLLKSTVELYTEDGIGNGTQENPYDIK